MVPVEFPQSNKVLRAPDGREDNISPLDTWTDGRESISCWEFTVDELRRILEGDGRVWVRVLSGNTQPPIALDVECPFEEVAK